MRYRLKFEYRMCLSVEIAGKFFDPSLQVSNMHYQLKLGDAFVGQNVKRQVHVIGENASKLMWPVTPSVKHALYVEVRRRFCGPKFLIPTMRYRCLARNVTDAFLYGFE